MRRLHDEMATTVRDRVVSNIGPGGVGGDDRSCAGLRPAVAGSRRRTTTGHPVVDPCLDGLMAEERALLFGRDAASQVIVAALGADPPGNLVIVGSAGVGRTRLAREALFLAEGEGRSTRWAAGTRAAARVPLGALAHLLPAIHTGADTLALLQQATRAIVGDRAGPRLVLGVDDVHLLDPCQSPCCTSSPPAGR
jgi:hypothetical protein